MEYVKGVTATGIVVETRLQHWTIQFKAESDDAENQAPASTENTK